jgi:hypothetical protein
MLVLTQQVRDSILGPAPSRDSSLSFSAMRIIKSYPFSTAFPVKSHTCKTKPHLKNSNNKISDASVPPAGTSVHISQPGYMHPPLYLCTTLPNWTKQVPSPGPLQYPNPSLYSPPLWKAVPMYLPGIVDCHGSNSDVGFAVYQLSDNTVPFLGKNRKPSSQNGMCHTFPQYHYRAGIFKKSMGARNRGGIGLSYRPAWLHRLAEFIPWNQFRAP